jgi:hypothetical protein
MCNLGDFSPVYRSLIPAAEFFRLKLGNGDSNIYMSALKGLKKLTMQHEREEMKIQKPFQQL